MVAIRAAWAREPTPCPCHAVKVHGLLFGQAPKKNLNLSSGKFGQGLSKVIQLCPAEFEFLNVLMNEGPEFFPFQSPLPSVLAAFPKKRVKRAGKNVPPAFDLLDNPMLEEGWDSGFESFRDGSFPADMVQNQQVMNGERVVPLLGHFFQEAHKGRIPNLTMKCESDLEAVGPHEFRGLFAMPKRCFKHQVHALAGPFHETALGEHIRQSAVTGILSIQNVAWINSGRETTRTFNHKAVPVLPDKDVPPEAVIAVTHGIQ